MNLEMIRPQLLEQLLRGLLSITKNQALQLLALVAMSPRRDGLGCETGSAYAEFGAWFYDAGQAFL